MEIRNKIMIEDSHYKPYPKSWYKTARDPHGDYSDFRNKFRIYMFYGSQFYSAVFANNETDIDLWDFWQNSSTYQALLIGRLISLSYCVLFVRLGRCMYSKCRALRSGAEDLHSKADTLVNIYLWNWGGKLE